MIQKKAIEFFFIFSCFVLMFLEGVNESIIGPVYPLRAKTHHGAGEFSIGITLAMFPLGQFVGSIALANLKFQSHIQWVFSIGAICSASSIAIFGLVDYLSNLKLYTCSNIAIRMMSGLALSCLWSTFYPIVSSTLKTNGVKFATFAVPTFFLGITIGPQFALLLNRTVGYSPIFFIVSSIELTFALIVFFTLLSSTNREAEEESNPLMPKKTFKTRDLLSIKGSYCFFITSMYFSINYGYIDGVLADILKNSFKFSEDEMQFVYLIASIFLVVFSSLSSWLSTMGYSYFIVMISCLAFSCSLSAMFCANYFHLTQLPIITAIVASVYTWRGVANTAAIPAFDIYVNTKFSEYSADEVRAVFMNLYCANGVLGMTIGSVFFISIVANLYGYFTSIITLSILGILITLLFFSLTFSIGALSRRSFLHTSQ